MQKKTYFNLRNLAWELLHKCQITELPVDLYKIAREKNWHIVTEKQYGQSITSEIELHQNGSFIIIVHKETDNLQRLRFGIAHEFGHILLGHLKLTPDELEKEANMFAARILMPAIILEELKIDTAEQIAEICNVSIEAARHRFKRLIELRKRNKFNTSPLERKVLENFTPFITSQK